MVVTGFGANNIHSVMPAQLALTILTQFDTLSHDEYDIFLIIWLKRIPLLFCFSFSMRSMHLGSIRNVIRYKIWMSHLLNEMLFLLINFLLVQSIVQCSVLFLKMNNVINNHCYYCCQRVVLYNGFNVKNSHLHHSLSDQLILSLMMMMMA